VAVTAIVVVAILAVTGSWAPGAVVGGVSGGVAAALYPDIRNLVHGAGRGGHDENGGLPGRWPFSRVGR